MTGATDLAKVGSLNVILTMSEKAIFEPFPLVAEDFAILGKDYCLRMGPGEAGSTDCFLASSFESGEPMRLLLASTGSDSIASTELLAIICVLYCVVLCIRYVSL